MQDFHQLDTWKKAHQLVLKIYRVSSALPDQESYGITLNLRRSSMSVARFIAEGAGRDADAEFAVDLKRARAALFELEYLVLLSRDLALISPELHDELTNDVIEVRKMISGLLKRISSLAETLR